MGKMEKEEKMGKNLEPLNKFINNQNEYSKEAFREI